MKSKLSWIVVAAVILAAALFAYFRFHGGSQIQNFTAKVERGPIEDVVEATGTINPIVTVLVGSQVSGTIAELRADFNSRVHKGDIVAVIDPALFKGALLEAKSDLANSKANLAAARANLDAAGLDASLVRGDALVERARRGVADHLAELPVGDWEWGTGTARQRLAHRLDVVSRLCVDAGPLRELADLSAALRAAMLTRWPRLGSFPVRRPDRS